MRMESLLFGWTLTCMKPPAFVVATRGAPVMPSPADVVVDKTGEGKTRALFTPCRRLSGLILWQ